MLTAYYESSEQRHWSACTNICAFDTCIFYKAGNKDFMTLFCIILIIFRVSLTLFHRIRIFAYCRILNRRSIPKILSGKKLIKILTPKILNLISVIWLLVISFLYGIVPYRKKKNKKKKHNFLYTALSNTKNRTWGPLATGRSLSDIATADMQMLCKHFFNPVIATNEKIII